METPNRRPNTRKSSVKKSNVKKGHVDLVKELRQAILNSGQTEYRIAKESGVPQPVLNRFLRDIRGVSLETAAKICAYLGLHLAPIRRLWISNRTPTR